MVQKQQFRVSGHDLELSKQGVEHKLASLKAQPITKVYVNVKNRKFPVKQALAEVAKQKGLIKSSFTTQDAVRVFNGLGFEVGEKKK
jgi:hypothetical protein